MLILASKSPRRIDILKRLGFAFEIIPAEIDENINTDIPVFIPSRLAEMKAEAVGLKHPDKVIVGMDTIVFYGNEVLGKPRDYEEAEINLIRLSGKWHSVISGVCILNINNAMKYTFTDLSRVKFKELNSLEIKKYLSLIDPLDKAGGYAIQEHGNMLIEKVEGSVDNIIGFPTEKFLKVIKFIEKMI